jgi:hypothetical protein
LPQRPTIVLSAVSRLNARDDWNLSPTGLFGFAALGIDLPLSEICPDIDAS